jgi:hypothetical protein
MTSANFRATVVGSRTFPLSLDSISRAKPVRGYLFFYQEKVDLSIGS